MLFHKHSWQEAISKTCFLTSLTSYVMFWLMDLIQPGFVARYFSVHIFLLGIIFFGIWWSKVVEEYTDRPLLQVLVAYSFGFILSVITWNSAKELGMIRGLLVIIAFLIPLFVLKILKSK
jgi:hypothetical protein